VITLADYFMGRIEKYGKELTDEMRDDAERTVSLVNQLIASMQVDGMHVNGVVSSGWRPTAVNSSTPGAAKKSNHLLCRACDLSDPEGVIDAWCLANLDKLEAIGLWLEHPESTPRWCHVQIVPPASGKRVFHP
jgi:hypothetical protein